MPNKRQVKKNLKKYGQKAKGKNKRNRKEGQVAQLVVAPV